MWFGWFLYSGVDRTPPEPQHARIQSDFGKREKRRKKKEERRKKKKKEERRKKKEERRKKASLFFLLSSFFFLLSSFAGSTQNGKSGLSKNMKKHYLQKVFRFRNRTFAKPYKNLGQMKEIWSKIRKWAPKTLKKHWLEQLFATHIANITKPYKPNGKTTLPEVRKSTPTTL